MTIYERIVKAFDREMASRTLEERREYLHRLGFVLETDVPSDDSKEDGQASEEFKLINEYFLHQAKSVTFLQREGLWDKIFPEKEIETNKEEV